MKFIPVKDMKHRTAGYKSTTIKKIRRAVNDSSLNFDEKLEIIKDAIYMYQISIAGTQVIREPGDEL